MLILDVESAPQEAYIWKRFKENISVDQVIKRTYLLCWSAKWLNDPESYYSDSLTNYEGWEKEPENDFEICDSMWQLLDEADVVVTHNGDSFDLPLLNARFLIHKMAPPSPYRSQDTCKMARRKFRFDQNKLEEIATVLGEGHKIKTGGFELWRRCKDGDETAFEEMERYCIQDTFLLERVYKRLAPFDNQHVHVFLDGCEERPLCPVCGSDSIQRNGYYNTNTAVYTKYRCGDCGHNLRSRQGEPLSKQHKQNILRSV